MKQIKFLTTTFLIGLLFIGCSSDDSSKNILDPDNPNNPTSGFSRIDFTIQGSDRNGTFSIIDDLNTQEIYSGGYAVVSEEETLINFGYEDETQELRVGFFISGGIGTQNFQTADIEEAGYMAFNLNFNTSGINASNDFFAKNLTVNITEYEIHHISGAAALIKKLKGTFSGTVMSMDKMVSGTHQDEHTIEGSFYYIMPNE